MFMAISRLTKSKIFLWKIISDGDKASKVKTGKFNNNWLNKHHWLEYNKDIVLFI